MYVFIYMLLYGPHNFFVYVASFRKAVVLHVTIDKIFMFNSELRTRLGQT